MKGLVTRNTHVQYESPITSSKKVMAKVKVFVHAHTPTRTPTPGLWHKLPGHSSRLAKKDKMSILWTFSMWFGDCSGQFLWTLTYQRQFLDVIQSGCAVKNATRLDMIWMKRSPSGFSFCSVCPISGGLNPTLFARNNWLFSKQLFYEY